MKYKTNLTKTLTKDFLIKEYITNKKSCHQIAKEVGCCHETIRKFLKKYNILIRNISYSKLLTKIFLYQEYIINKKSIRQIAKIINCSFEAIRYNLIKNNIKIKTVSEGQILNPSALTHGICCKNKKYFCARCGKKIHYTTILHGNTQCSSCVGKYRMKDSKNNPMKGKHHTEDTKQKIRNSNYHKNLKGCNNPMFGVHITGSAHYNWNNGKSFEPYPIAWTKLLKESIRQRDNHQCQICGKSTKKNGRKLDVHHIDYYKDNLKPNNLISLCKNCHMKTNPKKNRDIYVEYFKILKECINYNF